MLYIITFKTLHVLSYMNNSVHPRQINNKNITKITETVLFLIKCHTTSDKLSVKTLELALFLRLF